jgi:RNA polymerase sigma-70 factor, ECF subfamily
MDEPSPASLDRTVRDAADGDAEAWAVLVRGYSPRVFALLLRQCRNRDLAEELTQATFVKLVEQLNRYQEQGRFEAWLFRIAVNALRDEMRRRGRQATAVGTQGEGAGPAAESSSAVEQPQGPGRQPTPLEHLVHEEQLHAIRRAVDTLPEADREVLHLRFTAGLSFAGIAAALGQPLGTVLARSHRAIGKLRGLLGPSAGNDAKAGERHGQ